jgi:hypothetical protein
MELCLFVLLLAFLRHPIYQHDMMMFYATTEQFNPDEPDEHRLSWDIFGTEVWELNKG